MSTKSINLSFLKKYKPMTWVAFSTSNKVLAEAKTLSQLSEKIEKGSKEITIMMVPPKENFAPKFYR